MSSDLDAITRVVEAFERSDWSEVDVRSGDLRVRLSTRADDSAVPEPVTAHEAPDEFDRSPPATSGAYPQAVPEIPAGAQVVTSPSPGIFWRAPEPGAPPFTEVGKDVEPASTVCIVEVMKLMNHVKARVTGSVLEVYADNGAAVAKDQPLFAIALSKPAP